MAEGGERRAEYQCVLQNLDTITTQLEANAAAKDKLTRKFKSKEWTALTASPRPDELVMVALMSIRQDSGQ